MISELTIFSVVLFGLIGYAFLSARFYFHVTEGISSHKIPAKLRKPVSIALKLFMLLVVILIALVGVDAARIVRVYDYIPQSIVLIAAACFLFLVVAPFIALLSDYARERASVTNEAKIAWCLLVVSIVMAKFAFKALIGFAELIAQTKYSGDEEGTRSPFGYHGYLSYEEDAKRKHGQNY